MLVYSFPEETNTSLLNFFRIANSLGHGYHSLKKLPSGKPGVIHPVRESQRRCSDMIRCEISRRKSSQSSCLGDQTHKIRGGYAENFTSMTI